MKPYEVIKSKIWKRDDGLTASPFTIPWTSSSEEKRWKLVFNGWVIVNPNGTVGQGYPPCKTKDEAQQKADRWNKDHSARDRERVLRAGLAGNHAEESY